MEPLEGILDNEGGHDLRVVVLDHRDYTHPATGKTTVQLLFTSYAGRLQWAAADRVTIVGPIARPWKVGTYEPRLSGPDPQTLTDSVEKR